ncbi:MAG: DUF6465 family protein [Lachnospiraceae bacterium]|jgi:hypothetical protein|nr:DUF6465 family protein [Lachnospiraceae bacterium]MEE3461105.1 DUF6465 family protein [Lachnospiraceae bacterium]
MSRARKAGKTTAASAAAKKTAEVISQAAKTAPVKADLSDSAETTEEAAAVKKDAEKTLKKPAEKKVSAGKAEPVKKAAAKKAPAKETSVQKKEQKAQPKEEKKITIKAGFSDGKDDDMTQEVYLEQDGAQLDLVKKIEESYEAAGNKKEDIKKLQVYINLNSRKAYYVVNDKAEDLYVEF